MHAWFLSGVVPCLPADTLPICNKVADTFFLKEIQHLRRFGNKKKNRPSRETFKKNGNSRTMEGREALTKLVSREIKHPPLNFLVTLIPDKTPDQISYWPGIFLAWILGTRATCPQRKSLWGGGGGGPLAYLTAFALILDFNKIKYSKNL